MAYYLFDIKKISKKLTAENIVKQLFLNKEFNLLILDLNRESQLYNAGIDSLGKSLGEYADSTINFSLAKGDPFDGKIALGQPYGHVTLKDKGKFYESFILEFKSNADLLINANSVKDRTDLRDVYGDEILGLTPKSLEVVIFEAKKIVIPLIKQLILQR